MVHTIGNNLSPYSRRKRKTFGLKVQYQSMFYHIAFIEIQR